MRKGRPLDPLLAARRRRAFLRSLGDHGNMRIAAEAAGAPFMWFFRERARNPRFAGALAKAVAAGRAALAAGKVPRGHGKAVWSRHNGRAKLVTLRTPGARWNPDDQATFLHLLRRNANLSMSAEEAGFGITCIWQRRKQDAGFDREVRAAIRAGHRHLLRQRIAQCNAPVELPPPAEEADDMLAAMSNAALLNQLWLHRSVKGGPPHPTPYRKKWPTIEQVRCEVLALIAAIKDADDAPS